MFWQILFLMVLLIPLLAIVLDSQVGKALAARLEASDERGERSALQERVRYLEGEVERLTSDVQRLEEESEFLHKLLAERPPPEEPGGSALEAGENDA